MSLEPELREVCEDVYAYLQPDGSWYLKERGAPADLVRAFGEMVAHNGGQPLTCRA